VTSVEQRELALAQANRVRHAQWEIKHELSETLDRQRAKERAAAMLRHPDPVVSAMKVQHLLSAVPRVGPSKIAALLRAADCVTGDARIDRLTARQRGALADRLENGRATT